MSAGDKMRMSIRAAVKLAAWAIPLTACPAQDRGLSSVNQPVVSGGSAAVPGCPNWDARAVSSVASAANYGCAVNGNLAAMIADPADLIHGRAYTGADVEISTRAVRAWRDTPPTGKGPIEKTSAKGGN